jgi:hypothetical protein
MRKESVSFSIVQSYKPSTNSPLGGILPKVEIITPYQHPVGGSLSFLSVTEAEREIYLGFARLTIRAGDRPICQQIGGHLQTFQALSHCVE